MAEGWDDQWYCVGPARLARPDRPTRVRLHDATLAVWRTQDGRVVAIDDRCPHLGASLTARGRRTHGDEVVCPYHAMRFNTEGRCVHIEGKPRDPRIPKTLQSRAWSIREHQGWLFVLWSHPDAQEAPFEPLEELSSIPDDTAEHWSVRTWKCNFTRAVENSLDALHFWGVHAKVLPFVRYAEEEIQSAIEGNSIRLQTYRDGKPRPVKIRLGYPNVWTQLMVGNHYTTIAFVPVGDDRTDVWLRTNIVTPLGTRQVRGRAMHAAYAFALWQDAALVESQTPLHVDDARKDGIIAYDLPVANYRKLRRKLRSRELPQAESTPRRSYTEELAPGSREDVG